MVANVAIDLHRLYSILEYTFTDSALIITALTHRSYAAEHNERLEFLGDSVLGYVMADLLYTQFPDAKEGELSRMRANFVRGNTLSQLARTLGLGDFLLLGQGELKSGGHQRHSILEDAFEAVIGAIYLDGGIETVRTFIERQYQDRLSRLSLQENSRDAKSQLQEWLQGQGYGLPEYEIDRIEGPEHDQVFFVVCRTTALAHEVMGQGASRKRAEQVAAHHTLTQIKAQHDN